MLGIPTYNIANSPYVDGRESQMYVQVIIPMRVCCIICDKIYCI